MEKPKNERSLQNKPAPFRPNRKYVSQAVEEYLNRGGTITKMGTKTGYYSSSEGVKGINSY